MATTKKPFDTDLIRDLAMLIAETDLTEIEVAHGDLKIRVARNVTITAPVHMAPAPSYAPPVPTSAPGTAAPVSDFAGHPGLVKSPMVGTAYRAAEPGSAPFVDIGSKVREGQTLLIVEAMKTMNQIPAPRAGTVTAILFDDAAPVEYGEPLVVIE
ncbi:acetyl-CoA carboxylase biotin carboxyl carrier protein subunit [Prosthecomicrobium hirschii]|uniref:Biotin carboxyl carrier protein of acetyl-CoA carboxylase n=1 Tax=Prosthecodimorpha hirschii TaxID=665126 RepID=A0A0P6VWF5_9HYPH|nr:acetyl-CoA carboxylase biotin carboxyl carrier protein [Prosthecomicrobium hirschii]KPL51219.1 acetyl-CoA carboxylase biotin carboxyl carrier protein subunit [Prosthecomicrobium hirschii]